MVEINSADGKKHHIGKLDEKGNPIVTPIVLINSDFAAASGSTSVTQSSQQAPTTLNQAQVEKADLSDAGATASPGVKPKLPLPGTGG